MVTRYHPRPMLAVLAAIGTSVVLAVLVLLLAIVGSFLVSPMHVEFANVPPPAAPNSALLSLTSSQDARVQEVPKPMKTYRDASNGVTFQYPDHLVLLEPEKNNAIAIQKLALIIYDPNSPLLSDPVNSPLAGGPGRIAVFVYANQQHLDEAAILEKTYAITSAEKINLPRQDTTVAGHKAVTFRLTDRDRTARIDVINVGDHAIVLSSVYVATTDSVVAIYEKILETLELKK